MTSPLIFSPTRDNKETQVQVDLGSMAGMIGRIKSAPVCVDETLKKDSMSTEELKKLCFRLETPAEQPLATQKAIPVNEPSVVSSSSSTASRESATFSDADVIPSNKHISTPLRLDRKQSETIQKVTTQKTSRNGRQTQRYTTDQKTQRLCRMVTGCVPIVEGGKILFVSSSRKPDWILPKGGWEKDEEMDVSAIRETFEEAGVLGVLGPLLTEIEYETRKSKKRRKEFEEVRKRAKLLKEATCRTPTPSRVPNTEEAAGSAAVTEKEDQSQRPPIPVPQQLFNGPVSDVDLTKIRGQSKYSDETCSTASDSSQAHSHVKLYMFPLYVSDVKSSWPESGRFRTAVEIDEAIRLCEKRPELQTALIEVKKRNLHLPPPQCLIDEKNR